MFLAFSNIFNKNFRKRNNIKSKIDKSAPKSDQDYYLYL